MTIKLGLQRMRALYGNSPQPWQAVHVAGTNGKGSVCSYVSSLLTRSGISHGRFTSPFIRRPEDSILINNTPVPSELFRSLYWAADNSPAADKPTHFERMTYAAFAAFDHFGVKYGVVETGLGGRLDSTNVLKNKAVTVLTKMGLDHQEYLGDTIELIAAEKAAIMNGAPCVVNGRNSPEALRVILDTAHQVGSKAILSTEDARLAEEATSLTAASSTYRWPQHVMDNAICAIKACEQLEEFKDSSLTITELLKLPGAQMEGRLQEVDISATPLGRREGRQSSITLDGAHNLDAAKALGDHVDGNLRISSDGSSRRPICWVIGMSNPRESTASAILESLIRSDDRVVFAEYERPGGAADSMNERDYFLSFRPEPLRGEKLEAIIESLGGHPAHVASCSSAEEAVGKACQLAHAPKGGEMPIVVTGSLYLISDILTWVEKAKA